MLSGATKTLSMSEEKRLPLILLFDTENLCYNFLGMILGTFFNKTGQIMPCIITTFTWGLPCCGFFLLFTHPILIIQNNNEDIEQIVNFVRIAFMIAILLDFFRIMFRTP